MSSQGDEVPAGFLKNFRFDGGSVETLAKHAVYRDGDPSRLWTFSAHEVEIDGMEVSPPYTFEEDDEYSTMRAFYSGYETNCIVYFLENWAEEVEAGFSRNYLAWELHELTHWAVDERDNETGPSHWERWNDVIAEVVEYVTDYTQRENNA